MKQKPSRKKYHLRKKICIGGMMLELLIIFQRFFPIRTNIISKLYVIINQLFNNFQVSQILQMSN
jgi:hypothetical protein